MIDKIKGLRKYTDCSMPSNEKERLHKAEVSAYNQAIEDVVKLFAIPDVVGRSEQLVCDKKCEWTRYPKDGIWYDGCVKCGKEVAN